MALTAQERRQLLIDLVSGRISQEEYNSIMQYQLRRDAQTSQGMTPLPLTEAEKRLIQRANSGRNTTVTPTTSADQVIPPQSWTFYTYKPRNRISIRRW